MRIATWNVNSLAARLVKVTWWLERAQPDVLLMQETKLGDADVPRDEFSRLGYELAHHGEGGWNGVAIASRRGVGTWSPTSASRWRAPDRRSVESPTTSRCARPA